MQNKKLYIDFILDCFGKGIVERGEVLAKTVEKWQISPRTFDRHFKKAKETHSEHRELIEKQKLSTTIEKETKALKSQIKTKEEILLKLNEIIDQKAKRVDGQIIMPSFSDVRTAIDTYCKIQGYYAQTKVQLSGDSDNPLEINQVVVFSLPDNKRD